MVKSKKEKILVSLIVVLMVVLALGNISSLATSLTATPKDNANLANAVGNNTTENKATLDAVSATANSSNNSAKNTNKANTNTNTNSNTNKASNSANSANKKLPYAGTSGTVIFVVIALGVSAIYAYKKVSDYNI